MNTLGAIQTLTGKITSTLFGKVISYRVERDNKRPDDGRIFIQCCYEDRCTVTGKIKEWRGRKWYLSDHMSPDEIVKTCYAAFKATVEHEVMEAFKYEDQRVFNPHTPFIVLLEASKQQQFRQ